MKARWHSARESIAPWMVLKRDMATLRILNAQRIRRLCRLSAATILALALSVAAGDPNKSKNHVRKLDQGVYYPNTYYSRPYIQQFPLQPGDRPLFFRLSPFQHYGRYEQGCPIEPGLTDGGFQLRHFQYRYAWDFQAPEVPRPVFLNPCDDPRARHWEDLVAPEPGSDARKQSQGNLTARRPTLQRPMTAIAPSPDR